MKQKQTNFKCVQLAKFYVSTYKVLRYRQPPRFWSEQIEAHALIDYKEFSEFLTFPVDQYLSLLLTIAPSNLNYWRQLHWAWLSTSVCQILLCPFMIVPIFCHLNAKSKVSSMCMIELIQLTHCWSRDRWPIASTWFLATFCERYLSLVLFQGHCS